MSKPEKAEYNAYYEGYISLVDENGLHATLEEQPSNLAELLKDTTEERGSCAYEEGKWTIKELLGHINDGERMFAYRVLRISRGDATPIEGFEQDQYIENARSNSRTMAHLIDEFRLLRAANMLMLNNLSEEDWLRLGTASGFPVSVRALAYIMAGHVIHHVNILRERHLG